MQDYQGSKNFLVIKWKIKNFCVYNSKIHGKCLTDCSGDIELFPRGLHGDGNRLLARVYDENASSIELSYIGSDGSLLCLQKINKTKWDEGYMQLPPGPRFEEVELARKKSPKQRDILTLICRLEKSNNSWYSSQTTLIIHDIFLKVSTEMFEKMQKLGEPKWLFRARGLPDEDGCVIESLVGDWFEENGNDEDYTDIDSEVEDDGFGTGELDLTASITKSGHLAFVLEPDEFLVNFEVQSSLSLLDKEGIAVKSQQSKYLFRDTEKWVFSDILLHSEVMEKKHSIDIHFRIISKIFRKKSKFSISLDKHVQIIEPSVPSKDTGKPTCLNQPSTSVSVLSDELMALYQDEDHADFHLECGDVTFATHKGILSARSAVFKSMLSIDMKEAATGSMKITDLDVNTLGRFLTFLYTGTVVDLQWESALKLYYAADKYEVPSLKIECKTILRSYIAIFNVCNILSLADKHQDDELLSVTYEFISGNYNDVLKSDEWKMFMQSDPLLVSKTVTHLTIRLLDKEKE